MQNFSFEDEFNLHGNEPVCETHFHMNGFIRKIVLTQSQKELGNGLLPTISFVNRVSLKRCGKNCSSLFSIYYSVAKLKFGHANELCSVILCPVKKVMAN